MYIYIYQADSSQNWCIMCIHDHFTKKACVALDAQTCSASYRAYAECAQLVPALLGRHDLGFKLRLIVSDFGLEIYRLRGGNKLDFGKLRFCVGRVMCNAVRKLQQVLKQVNHHHLRLGKLAAFSICSSSVESRIEVFAAKEDWAHLLAALDVCQPVNRVGWHVRYRGCSHPM